MDLSIVIPAFNEEGKIATDVKAAAEFMEGNHFTGQIIVVDDGSSDKTSDSAHEGGVVLPSDICLEVIRYDRHRGKGCAVRTGILKSRGKYVMFADSGCCVPFGNVLLGIQMITRGECDIAHGSRKLLASDIQQDQPWHRRQTAKLFRRVIDKILTLPKGITDSQCGFKVYRGDVAREVYADCLSNGFMFDIEVILRSEKAGYRIREFPVEWVCDLDSRLSVLKTPLPVLFELLAIKRRIKKKE
jgi:dolichyl-phosphate beta-glucosyltransferase